MSLNKPLDAFYLIVGGRGGGVDNEEGVQCISSIISINKHKFNFKINIL